jgi:hypothetical protein
MQAITLEQAKKLDWEPASGNKYHNIKTEYKGDTYDSKKEADYAVLLDTMKRAKGVDRVLSWERQVPYKIKIDKILICTYYCDFVVKYADGRIEHIDVKGVKTDVYKIKKKLVKALHNIDILER